VAAGAWVGLALWPFYGGLISLFGTGAILGFVVEVVSEKKNWGVRLVDAPNKFFACVLAGLALLAHVAVIGDPAGGFLSFEASKLGAFRKVVKKYQSSPGDYAPGQVRERYNRDLDQLQEAFFKIKFDPKQNRKEAQAIVELWRKEIEGRYTGECPRLLENYVLSIYEKVTD